MFYAPCNGKTVEFPFCFFAEHGFWHQFVPRTHAINHREMAVCIRKRFLGAILDNAKKKNKSYKDYRDNPTFIGIWDSYNIPFEYSPQHKQEKKKEDEKQIGQVEKRI